MTDDDCNFLLELRARPERPVGSFNRISLYDGGEVFVTDSEFKRVAAIANAEKSGLGAVFEMAKKAR